MRLVSKQILDYFARQVETLARKPVVGGAAGHFQSVVNRFTTSSASLSVTSPGGRSRTQVEHLKMGELRMRNSFSREIVIDLDFHDRVTVVLLNDPVDPKVALLGR